MKKTMRSKTKNTTATEMNRLLLTVDVLGEGDIEEIAGMIDLPPFPLIIEDQVVASPIYEVVVLLGADMNKFDNNETNGRVE